MRNEDCGIMNKEGRVFDNFQNLLEIILSFKIFKNLIQFN